jgi:hypothetical protein
MQASGHLHAPAALPQGKSLCYPLDRRLDVPQGGFGRGGEEKSSQPLPELETQIIHWAISTVYNIKMNLK